MKVAFVFTGRLEFRARLWKQVRSLQKNGHECLVINGQVETSQSNRNDYSATVKYIPVSQRCNKLLTLCSQISFNLHVVKILRRNKVEAVVCIGLPNALSGAWIRRQGRVRLFLFDSNELALEKMKGLKRLVWRPVQSFVLKYADVVIHPEKNRLDYFFQKYKPKGRPFLLENLPDLEPLTFPVDAGSDMRRKAVYLGLLIPGRSIRVLIDAFAALAVEDMTLDIIGYFDSCEYRKKVTDQVESLDNENVRLLPSVPHERIYDCLRQYGLGLAFYDADNLNNYYCAPNKIYDYIAVGMPVITNDHPGLKDVVEKNRIGVCLRTVTVETICRAVREVQQERMNENITPELQHRYSWKYQQEAYCSLFR